MNRPTCKTCPYWEPGNHERDQDGNGWCHRYPRRIVETILRLSVDEDVRADPSLADGQTLDCVAHEIASDCIVSCFPPHSQTEWCGEHPDFPTWIAATRQPQTSQIAQPCRNCGAVSLRYAVDPDCPDVVLVCDDCGRVRTKLQRQPATRDPGTPPDVA